jgi:hypothetical protein
MYQEALLGVLLKLCDDVFDKTISVSPVVEETLKALLVVFFVLVSAGDFYFASGVFFLLLANPKTDTAFWKAMIPVAGVLMVLNYANESHFGIFLAGLALVAAIVYTEDRSFPEEVSTKKILFRVTLVGILIVMLMNGYIKLLVPEYLDRTITKATTVGMMYLLTSVSILTLKSEVL